MNVYIVVPEMKRGNCAHALYEFAHVTCSYRMNTHRSPFNP